MEATLTNLRVPFVTEQQPEIRATRNRAAAITDISAAPTQAPSFEAFYAEHHQRVARALAFTLRDGELAADAANEAMTRAYQRWLKISSYRDPAGWVYRVGLNWALSWKRRRRRERDRPVQLAAATSELALRDDRLDDALSQLSVDHRAVVACRIYLEWSVDETAEALKIPPGTVKSRLARATAALEQHLNAESPAGQNWKEAQQ